MKIFQQYLILINIKLNIDVLKRFKWVIIEDKFIYQQ
jgi:hypothetical protein